MTAIESADQAITAIQELPQKSVDDLCRLASFQLMCIALPQTLVSNGPDDQCWVDIVTTELGQQIDKIFEDKKGSCFGMPVTFTSSAQASAVVDYWSAKNLFDDKQGKVTGYLCANHGDQINAYIQEEKITNDSEGSLPFIDCAQKMVNMLADLYTRGQ